MRELSRRLGRWDPVRVAAAGSGVAAAILLAAYVAAGATVQPTPGGILAALALLVIAGSGLLYAWRLGAGGLVE
jgi:hypothetical protein